MAKKICNKCKIEKELTEFYKDKQKKDGYSPTCKECKYEKKDVEARKAIKRQELEQEYIGKKFGFLTVVKVPKERKEKHIMYECQCDCGKQVVKRKTELKNGRATSCGCEGSNATLGKRYGKLIATSNAYRIDERLYVDVVCDCGTRKSVMKQSLESGLTVSCGCYNIACRQGENSPKWKGGITPLSKYLRGVVSEWKDDTRRMYGSKCDITGYETNLVHHLYPLSFIIEETLDALKIDIRDSISCYNREELDRIKEKCLEVHYKYGLGVCLIEELHKEFHSIYGYGDNTPEQYYEFKNNKLSELNREELESAS